MDVGLKMLQCRTPLAQATLRQTTCALRGRHAQATRKLPAQRRFISDSTAKSAKTSPSPSPPPPSFDPSKAPIQIRLPGPAWLWKPFEPLKYPLAAYNRAQRSRPYLTQFFTTLVIFATGDLLSQYIEWRAPAPPVDGQASSAETPAPSAYDPQRSVRALIIGGIISIPSYRWFMYLAKLWPTLPKLQGVVLKVGLQCALFAPVISTYFFTMQSLLAGNGGDSLQGKADAAWARVKTTVPTSWMTGLWFWPFVTGFSFSVVSPMNRSIFNGVAGVCWQSYLGVLNNRAKARERELGSGAQPGVKVPELNSEGQAVVKAVA